jgi:hypothetical protein
MELGIFKILNIDERGTKSDFDFFIKNGIFICYLIEAVKK